MGHNKQALAIRAAAWQAKLAAKAAAKAARLKRKNRAWAKLHCLAKAKAYALIRPSFDIYAIISEAKFAGNKHLMLGAQAILAQHLAKHGHSCIAPKRGA